MDAVSSTQQTTASSTFNKNEFLLSKLSEMATRSDQISNAMQIALGFIMTLTAALLAILVSIGQTINGNSCDALYGASSFADYLFFLFSQENIILWAACVVFSFIGSSSNLTALAIHEHADEHYNELEENYHAIVSELVQGDAFFEKYNALTTLPKLQRRIKEGRVESIYLRTACAFHCLFALFLACFLESLSMLIMIQLDECSIIMSSIVFLALSIDVALGIFRRLKIENKNPSVSDYA